MESSKSKIAYLITLDIEQGENECDAIMADTLEESLIFVGRLIERLNKVEHYYGKYIYVVEYISENGDDNYKENACGFKGKYLIEN